MAHAVLIGGLPPWLDAARLLGPGFAPDAGGWRAELPTDAAADVAARLRGLGFGGRPVAVDIRPGLGRTAVRAARTRDARRRWETTPGFLRPGTQLDAEGRWSLTPEALALALGRQAAGRDIVDATCGCGGNAIGFARAGCRVTAIDVDPDRLAMARANAALYGVADRIRFRCGSAPALVPTLEPALVFVDPPWGEAWDRVRTPFDALPVVPELLAALPADAPVWVKAPPSIDPEGAVGFTPEAWFGEAPGDRQRVKFIVLRRGSA